MHVTGLPRPLPIESAHAPIMTSAHSWAIIVQSEGVEGTHRGLESFVDQQFSASDPFWVGEIDSTSTGFQLCHFVFPNVFELKAWRKLGKLVQQKSLSVGFLSCGNILHLQILHRYKIAKRVEIIALIVGFIMDLQCPYIKLSAFRFQMPLHVIWRKNLLLSVRLQWVACIAGD